MPRLEARLLLKKEGFAGTPGRPDDDGVVSRVAMAVGNTNAGSLLPLKPSLEYLSWTRPSEMKSIKPVIGNSTRFHCP